MNYPFANYSGLGWLSETELAAFVSDENGGVLGYYLENDMHLYSLNLPPFVEKLDCHGVNDINNDTRANSVLIYEKNQLDYWS